MVNGDGLQALRILSCCCERVRCGEVSDQGVQASSETAKPSGLYSLWALSVLCERGRDDVHKLPVMLDNS